MSDASANESAAPGFRRSLSLLDGTMLVAGSMIGSGIFIVSADIVRMTGGAGWLVLVWLISGVMTVAGALAYGELSAMYPKAGGQYVYLREAWGRLPFARAESRPGPWLRETATRRQRPRRAKRFVLKYVF